MPRQKGDGFGDIQPEAEQNRRLDVTARLLDMARCVLGRAADDFADHRFGSPAKLCVAGPHVDHKAEIDASEPHHDR